jgi:hypothetical protein
MEVETMPRKAKPETVRVRNTAPFSQALYVTPTYHLVVDPGAVFDCPRARADEIVARSEGWLIMPETPEEGVEAP